MLNLLQLRVLVFTVRYGKLVSVAQALGISQPTVTFHLSKLEEEAGQPLFVSNTRKANRLTDFGRSLYRHAERMLALEDELNALVNGSQSLRFGRVRMGSTHTPATYFLPTVFSAFIGLHPEVDVTLDVLPSHLLIPKLLNYDLDFCCMNHFPVAHPDLTAEPILEDRLVMIVHPDHPAASVYPLTPEHFSEFPFIMHESGSVSRQIINDWCQEQRIQPNIRMEVSGTETMKELVKKNLGVAFISEMSCRSEIHHGWLAKRDIPQFTHRRQIFRVQRKDFQLTGVTRAFLAMLESVAREDGRKR